MPSGDTIKVLVAGEVQGRIDALFKRVGSVNASNGPFDLLLCVGAFFNPAGPPLLSNHPCSRLTTR
jgi:hypothetical protein